MISLPGFWRCLPACHVIRMGGVSTCLRLGLGLASVWTIPTSSWLGTVISWPVSGASHSIDRPRLCETIQSWHLSSHIKITPRPAAVSDEGIVAIQASGVGVSSRWRLAINLARLQC